MRDWKGGGGGGREGTAGEIESIDHRLPVRVAIVGCHGKRDPVSALGAGKPRLGGVLRCGFSRKTTRSRNVHVRHVLFLLLE